MDTLEIYLVPGFLGFREIASLPYFVGVHEVLERKLRQQGIHARVHVTETVPAGALTKRATKLAEELWRFHDPRCESIHLLGHSTGGLDIRLLLSPGSDFDVDGALVESVAERAGAEDLRARHGEILGRVKSAMSLATPHYGTPAAALFLRIGFDQILADVTALEGKPRTRDVILGGLGLGAAALSLGSAVGLTPGFLRWMNRAVLSYSPQAVLDYLHEIGRDLGALRNLTRESASLFDATVRDRPGVRYFSFCTGTDRPHGPIPSDDPAILLNTHLYRLLYAVVAEQDPAHPYAPPGKIRELHDRLDEDGDAGLDVGALELEARTSDGMVPTYSQAYGEIGAVVASDHLDCVGMFPGDWRTGWIRSGAEFRKSRFELLWGRIADSIAAAHRGERSAVGSGAPPAMEGETSGVA